MQRSDRTKLAGQTVAICDAGYYTAPDGRRVDVGDAVRQAVTDTVLYSPENPVPDRKAPSAGLTSFAVANETAFAAIARLAAAGGHVACLNFASAKNPGGGFLNG